LQSKVRFHRLASSLRRSSQLKDILHGLQCPIGCAEPAKEYFTLSAV